jgi:ppGpp synthetase/RelA/SpoT-type nucleotidyltranferase
MVKYSKIQIDSWEKIEANIRYRINKDEIMQLSKKLNSIPKRLENAELHFKTLMSINHNNIEYVLQDYLGIIINHPEDFFYKKCYELAKNYT